VKRHLAENIYDYLPWIFKYSTDRKIRIFASLLFNCITSFFRFVNKRAIYRLGIISLAHAPVHVTDFPVVNVHVDELSSPRIWQHKMCATLSANININYRLPIKVYYRMCTLRHIIIEIMHFSYVKLLFKYFFFNEFKVYSFFWAFYSSECLCGILPLGSTVGCQISTLHCEGGYGAPEIFPVCPDVD
jgi:hypothetical protein